MKIITVDAGKFNGKGIMDNERMLIRTKLQKVDNQIFTDNSNSFNVNWKGVDYLLGDSAKEVDLDTSKKKLNHKLAAYTLCSKLMGDVVDEINLVILSPLSTFINPQKREEFRQYIIDDGFVDFKLDDIKQQLILNDVFVFGEACGVGFSNPEKFKNKVVGIIDIGGLNVNGVVLNNFVPIRGTEFTYNAGSYLIMEKIRKLLNSELDANVQDYQMESIIQQGHYGYNKEVSSAIISSVLSDHFREIITNMKASNWDVKGLDVVVTGGGSVNLGLNNITKFIPKAQMSNDPIWDNCKGGKIVGESIYG